MKAGKIALWTFGALVLSGMLFAYGVTEDARKSGGVNFSFGDIDQWGPGEVHTVDQTETVSADQFKKIEIRTDSPDLTVSLKSGNEVSAHLYGTVKTSAPAAIQKLVKVENGDTLVFKLERQSSAIVGFHNSNLKLDATLPEGWHGDLKIVGASSEITMDAGSFASLAITTASGDHKLGTISTDGLLKLESASGEMQVKSAECGEAFMTSASGDKRIQELTVKGKLDLTSASGVTDLGRTAAGTLGITTVSGDVRMGETKAESIRINGASSTIKGLGLSGQVEVNTASGDVTLDMTGPDKAIAVSTASGRVQVTVPAGTGLDVEARSASGSMTGNLKLDGGKKTEHSWTGTAGDKSVRVKIGTASGDVNLN